MRNVTFIFSAVALTMGLAGCQIAPVQYAGTADPQRRCSAISKRVMVDPPGAWGAQVSDGTAEVSLPAGDPLVRELESLYSPAAIPAAGPVRADPGDEPVSNSMLLLSGGSENGAFGAGYMSGWASARPKGLPRFRLVTGISTGALQSTFAFLDRAPLIKQEYEISHERQLLHPFTKGGLKSKSKAEQLRGALSLAQKGAVAELQPLRARLHELIDDKTLRAVAAEAGEPDGPDRRKLLVGAVEMDSGDAYLFDLTEAARLYVAGNAGMRECYIEALLASSSVPMAALPVFIDGKMYIDGGARFGVIADLNSAVLRRISRLLPASDPKNLFIIVNGTLEVAQTCHLKNCEENPLPPTPAGEVPQHGKWSFDKLALRSLSVLINQSYRSSVFWADAQSKSLGFTPYFMRIRRDSLAHPMTLSVDKPEGETLTCAQWKARDVQRDAPLEFHPRFMRCLVDYGRTRPEVAGWAKAE